ncbi:MAG: primase-helicase zinc-binding domain-containing protein [Marinomonas sp.]
MGNFYNKEEVLLKATGMWQKLLPQLCGMHETTFNGKHQPCPCCGGKDRFRFDDNLENKGDGGYVCSQCGSGNGLSLLMKSTGIEFGAALTMLGEWLACVPIEKVAMIKKEIASQNSLPKSAKTFTEDAEALIKCCAEHKKIPTFFTKHSEGKFRCLILNDYESVFPIINATGTIVNAAIVNPYGDVDFVGEFTYGAFSIIGDNTDKWIVCQSIKESIKIHEQTGFRVVCTWGSINLDEVLIHLGGYSKRCFIACEWDDKDTHATVESFNLKVVLPQKDKTIIESGVVRKAINASDMFS